MLEEYVIIDAEHRTWILSSQGHYFSKWITEETCGSYTLMTLPPMKMTIARGTSVMAIYVGIQLITLDNQWVTLDNRGLTVIKSDIIRIESMDGDKMCILDSGRCLHQCDRYGQRMELLIDGIVDFRVEDSLSKTSKIVAITYNGQVHLNKRINDKPIGECWVQSPIIVQHRLLYSDKIVGYCGELYVIDWEGCRLLDRCLQTRGAIDYISTMINAYIDEDHCLLTMGREYISYGLRFNYFLVSMADFKVTVVSDEGVVYHLYDKFERGDIRLNVEKLNMPKLPSSIDFIPIPTRKNPLSRIDI